MRAASMRAASMRAASMRAASRRAATMRAASMRAASMRPASMRPASMRAASMRAASGNSGNGKEVFVYLTSHGIIIKKLKFVGSVNSILHALHQLRNEMSQLRSKQRIILCIRSQNFTFIFGDVKDSLLNIDIIYISYN